MCKKNKQTSFEKHLDKLAPCKIDAEAKRSLQMLITMYIKEAVTKSAEYAKECNRDLDQECFLAVKESVDKNYY